MIEFTRILVPLSILSQYLAMVRIIAITISIYPFIQLGFRSKIIGHPRAHHIMTLIIGFEEKLG